MIFSNLHHFEEGYMCDEITKMNIVVRQFSYQDGFNDHHERVIMKK